MQGRFWEEQLGSLNIPAASRSKFAFEDGNPRVCTTPFSGLLTRRIHLTVCLCVVVGHDIGFILPACFAHCTHDETKQPVADKAVLLGMETCKDRVKLVSIHPSRPQAQLSASKVQIRI